MWFVFVESIIEAEFRDHLKTTKFDKICTTRENFRWSYTFLSRVVCTFSFFRLSFGEANKSYCRHILRPRPKTGVTFADQLPRGAAVGRGEKSRHDAAMQALGVDR